MKITPLYLLLFLLATAFVSCKKGDDDPTNPPSKSKTALLTQLPWRKYSNIICTEIIKDCEKDDRYSFRTDGKMVRTFGFSPCNAGEADELNNTWSFSADETSLTINYEFYGQVTWAIDSLTEDKLILSAPLPSCVETVIFLH